MDLDHKTAEELARMSVWAEDSLWYARERGQRALVRLLGAVKADVQFGEALLAVPMGEHPGSSQGSARGESAPKYRRASDAADDVRKREREAKKNRARLAAWELFMQAELRELGLRQDGQLARLLGEPMPGESPAALERLAYEDQRQAEEGLVALMRDGKVSYKLLTELCPEEMPARAAANRLRETWLKERLDGWLGRGEASGQGS